MASTLSALGLGSDSVLTYDVIDQLREVDDAAQVTPIDTRITENTVKQTDLSAITTYAATLKTSTSSLASENTYLKRSTSVSGSAISVSTVAGTTIQDFSVEVSNLALRDVYQSKSFSSESETFATGDDTIELTIDGETYEVEVSATTTISQLKDKIYDATDGKVSASILNVGGDEPYKLVIKSTDTGANNAISIWSENGSALNLELNNSEITAEAATGNATQDDILRFTINGNEYTVDITAGDSINEVNNLITLQLGGVLSSSVVDGKLVFQSLDGDMSVTSDNGSDVIFGLNSLSSTESDNHIQVATNASFKFNGVIISRESNTIDDLITGVDITLNEAGTSNVSITQDSSQIESDLESFVTAYNNLISNLNAATKYDADSGTAGTLQGVSQITGLKASINRQLLSINEDGVSLADYGIELNSSGILEFDSETFNAKLSEDADALKSFFIGSTTTYPTSIKGSSMSAGAIDIAENELIINNTSIVISLNGTQEENIESMIKAINEAGIDGVEAVLNSNGDGIKLVSNSGYDISISGDDTKLASLGLKAVSTYGKTEKTDGYFTKFNSLLADYITGDEAILALLDTQLQTQADSLTDERARIVARLDKKYEVMATKFAAYDSIISKLNTQFATLQSMIDAEYNNDN